MAIKKLQQIGWASAMFGRRIARRVEPGQAFHPIPMPTTRTGYQDSIRPFVWHAMQRAPEPKAPARSQMTFQALKQELESRKETPGLEARGSMGTPALDPERQVNLRRRTQPIEFAPPVQRQVAPTELGEKGAGEWAEPIPLPADGGTGAEPTSRSDSLRADSLSGESSRTLPRANVQRKSLVTEVPSRQPATRYPATPGGDDRLDRRQGAEENARPSGPITEPGGTALQADSQNVLRENAEPGFAAERTATGTKLKVQATNPFYQVIRRVQRMFNPWIQPASVEGEIGTEQAPSASSRASERSEPILQERADKQIQINLEQASVTSVASSSRQDRALATGPKIQTAAPETVRVQRKITDQAQESQRSRQEEPVSPPEEPISQPESMQNPSGIPSESETPDTIGELHLDKSLPAISDLAERFTRFPIERSEPIPPPMGLREPERNEGMQRESGHRNAKRDDTMNTTSVHAARFDPPAARAGSLLPTVPRKIQRAVRPAGEERTEARPDQDAVPPETRQTEIAATVLQRREAEADEPATVQRYSQPEPSPAAPEATASTTAVAPAAAAAPAQDVDKLALQVYAILRRRLRVEIERTRGSGG